MLRKKLLDPSKCATCKGSISLVQINGKTLAVETAAGWIGGSLIVLELHRCAGPAPAGGPREGGARR